MLISNIETICRHCIVRHLGVVTGSTVRTRRIGRGFVAGLKNIVGGEISGHAEPLSDARQEAIARMVQSAQRLDANAAVTVRLNTASIMTQSEGRMNATYTDYADSGVQWRLTAGCHGCAVCRREERVRRTAANSATVATYT